MSSKSIVDMFRAAKTDYLQEQWDKELIRMWREPGHVNIALMCERFIEKELISIDEFLALQHAPPMYYWMYKVPRFIAAFLPRTNKILFDGGSDEAALRCLKSEKLLFKPGDASPNERRKIKLEIQASLISNGISARRIHNANHGDTNWNTVK